MGMEADSGVEEHMPTVVVAVTVVKAERLAAMDWSGTSDPFAEVVIGTAVRRTKVVSKTLNPEWNETVRVPYEPAGMGVGLGSGGPGAAAVAKEELHVVVYDHDKGLLGGSKEFIGAVSLDLRVMPVGTHLRFWRDLVWDGRFSKEEFQVTGRILLEIDVSRSPPAPLPPGRGVIKTSPVHFGGMWRGQIVLSDRDRRGLGQPPELDTRVASGNGTCSWPDRSRFQGTFRHGVPHGEGRLYHADSDERYEGLWGEGQREGFGRWWGAGGEQYVGEWRKGRYHGRGELLTRRGGAYWGGFSEGLFHGIGVLVFQDGQVYIGGFEDGKRHGTALEFLVDEAAEVAVESVYDTDTLVSRQPRDIIRGQFILDTSYKRTRREIAGHPCAFELGNRPGRGGKIKAEIEEGEVAGAIFEGHTRRREMDGWCSLKFWRGGPNGEVEYNGMMSLGSKEGIGEMKYLGGKRYSGCWFNGLPWGPGVEELESGERYEGEFREGERCGFGRLFMRAPADDGGDEVFGRVPAEGGGDEVWGFFGGGVLIKAAVVGTESCSEVEAQSLAATPLTLPPGRGSGLRSLQPVSQGTGDLVAPTPPAEKRAFSLKTFGLSVSAGRSFAPGKNASFDPPQEARGAISGWEAAGGRGVARGGVMELATRAAARGRAAAGEDTWYGGFEIEPQLRAVPPEDLNGVTLALSGSLALVRASRVEQPLIGLQDSL